MNQAKKLHLQLLTPQIKEKRFILDIITSRLSSDRQFSLALKPGHSKLLLALDQRRLRRHPAYEQIYALVGPMQTYRVTGDPAILAYLILYGSLKDPAHLRLARESEAFYITVSDSQKFASATT